MKTLLFSMEGRIPRSQFWLAALIYIGLSFASGLVVWALSGLLPGTVGEDGGVTVTGPAAIPYIVLALGYLVFTVWSGICVNVKRCHDRGRSGLFMLIMLVPVLNLWYLIEAYFLRGTVGPNRYGPDPLAGTPGYAPYAGAPQT